jgi:aspartyl-tRNA(Asn)/glutamyl-tRNA(Gln) amidotransferase subunit B
LPAVRRSRFASQFSLPEYDAIELTRSRSLADYFEEVVSAGAPPKAASNWLMGEVTRKSHEAGVAVDHSPVSALSLAELIGLVDRGTINSTTAKDVFEKMWTSGRSAQAIVDAEGLAQVSDEGAIGPIVDQVLAAQPDTVAQYRGGQTKVLGFLVGQVMKATGGKASPKLVNELVRRALDRG